MPYLSFSTQTCKDFNMFRSLIIALSASLMLSLNAAASDHGMKASMGKSALIAAQGELLVTAINHETREVTLKNSDGEERSFVIGKEARNLDQVDVGDIVTITTAEGYAVRLYPAADAAKGSITKTGISRSDLGQKPHVSITRHVELTGKVAALDKEARMATLDGKEGSLTLQVADDVDMDAVNIGDMVRVEFVEMLSITVNAPAK